MPAGRKKPTRGLYTCAEDLCDPYDLRGGDRVEEGGGESRPRRHAVRLVEEMRETRSNRSPRSVRSPQPDRSPQEPVAVGLPLAKSPVKEPLGEEYTILSVTPEGEGETVAIVLRTPASAGGEKRKLHLLVEQYTDLSVRTGIIDPETADALLAAGRLCAAIRRGMHLLAYGDQSARRLVFKLTAKGVDRASAEAAAAYLTERGYIREDTAARLRVEADLRKGWGPRRIREDLRANGFTPEAIDDAMQCTLDCDFEEMCASVIRKKYRSVPGGRAERQKMIAALLRLGYDMEVIRAAMRQRMTDHEN